MGRRDTSRNATAPAPDDCVALTTLSDIATEGAGMVAPGAGPVRVRARADLCVVIFNTHEFVYVP